MAANATTLPDDDGAFSDWIELHNPDATAADLSGWHLTDAAGIKTKWPLPAITLPPGGYLVVFASNKDRRDPARPLHTNFALGAGGEYLGLIRPDGSVAFEFAPQFPAQSDDVSYGVSRHGQKGALQQPTPGATNTAIVSEVSERVAFSRSAGPFTEPFALELLGAGAGQRIRYVAVLPSSLGVSAPEPTAQSTEYTAPIAIDSSILIRAAVFAADGTRGPVSSVHFVKVTSSALPFTTQLPLLVLDHHGAGQIEQDGLDHPMWLYAYSPRGGAPVFTSAPEVASPVIATVRGQSSAQFAKKPYNLKFQNERGGKRTQALFDSSPYEKWTLISPFDYDRTYIHNAFAYRLSNRLGRWAPRTQFTELIFNHQGEGLEASDYAGVYILTDRIEVGAGRVNIASLDSTDTDPTSITGGYLLKIDVKDDDEFGFRTSRGIPQDPASSVVIAHPKADDLAPAQRDYIQRYVQEMEDTLYADLANGFATRRYLDYIDRASWVDHHILNTMAGNPDAFQRSAYFTKDRNGKLVAGPVWDFDRAFASADPRSAEWKSWRGDDIYVRDVWHVGWWEPISRDPEFMQEWVDRWQSLRQTEFSNAALRGLIDSLAAEVGPLAAARDAARWPENTSRFGNHAGEIENMKTWLTNRAGWIDEQFVAPPRVVAQGETLRLTPAAGAQLVYTLDGSDPRSLGGDIAPNAVIADGPADVPASANVHARSYRADLIGVFPGTPWSSDVGGANSSPLRPASRMVNISTRGVVGNDETALIVGVVIADTAAKRYVSRAVGPALSRFGAAGLVPDPQLGIFNQEGVEIYRNNGWQTGPDAALLPRHFQSVGAFPLPDGSADSALAATMGSAAYTLQVTSPSRQEGVGLAELYELDRNGRTVNLSTRGFVRTGGSVLIGGFVVQGAAHKRVLIRAVGPTLSAFQLANALLDPVLTVYSGQDVIATNDRWEASNAPVISAATARVGAFALASGSEDAAMLITVPPGAYTVEVRGKNDTEGVALLEIYEVP